jgi:hypothetical protein
MRDMKSFTLLLILSLILAACNRTPLVSNSNQPEAPLPPTSLPLEPTPTYVPPAEGPETVSQKGLTRIDEQGMVVVEVTPLNLSNPGDALAFEVALNTHSVDLSMDLAELSTLNTGNGKSLTASLWEAPRDGHHVSGTLYFPALLEGQPVLKGAGEIQLVIEDLDVPERTFTWEVNP